MARKCTCTHIDPNQATCCRAAAAGRLGQPFVLQTPRGTRCAQCDQIQKRNGQPGFRFRFAKSQNCGLGAGGCRALTGGAQMGAPQGFLLQ